MNQTGRRGESKGGRQTGRLGEVEELRARRM